MMKTKDRVTDTAENVRPYVRRAVTDEEVRDSVKSALAAARDVYSELMGDRGVTHMAARVATDKDIQENLRNALDDLKHAADRIQGKEDHSTRNAVLLLTGITLGILFNPVTGPATRKWVADRIFGPSGEEFTYGSNSPATSYTEPEPTSSSSTESTSSTSSTSSEGS